MPLLFWIPDKLIFHNGCMSEAEMQQENIRYVLVWSGWIRLIHWLMAAGVLFLFASAWAIQHGNVDYEFWRDWHMIVGQLLLITVVARVILMFLLPGSAHWSAFLPDKAQWEGVKQMLLFYLSFARFPLPNWYAHNPFWKLLYPGWLLLLIVTAVIGLFYNSASTLLGMSMFKLHAGLAGIILILTVAHVLAAFLHDLKGKGAAISGMISGYRYFHVEKQEGGKAANPAAAVGKASIVHVSIDSIQKMPKR
ncbi:cytochrome b/b6 domain-containing protein [Thiothrix lacustris]|uniref:cytochrome b/b6 domain-containing protein n=1 Tax=Thiothrix lacustris TaxID=525917 RepID=UPI00048DE32D|nr:cytochrome b/b6 domain-containing protein [Thiothrix lacustris]